jgi:NADH dehydrogenase
LLRNLCRADRSSLRSGRRLAPHVVILGGGFGGLTAAQALSTPKVRVTLVDRSNHHLFQPLLYQVAMAGLSPAEIASPIRAILAHQKNARVLLAEAVDFDLDTKVVKLVDGEISYDFLIVATGAQTSYFGHDEWAEHALGLKSLTDAIEIRERVLLAFERAERETDATKREHLLTFVVIGGGPTGVELAGAIAELARHVLARDFRSIDLAATRVILLEAGTRILSTFPEKLSGKAVKQLAELGVEVRHEARVTNIDALGVHLGDELLASATVLWGAGVRATPLGEKLGVPLDRAGRVIVQPDLTLPDHPEVFVIGDMATMNGKDGKPLPGVSPVAMQQARCAAKSIRAALGGKPRVSFEYFDKGTMATIGRSRAIADLAGGMRLSGFLAWVAWLLIHLVLLIGYRNRLAVLIDWFWSYVTYRRGARLITHVTAPRPAVVPKPD